MTTDEIQDAIVDAADRDTYYDINDYAYVAVELNPTENHIEEGWEWCRVSGFEVEYDEDDGMWEFRSILMDDNDDDDDGFTPVCGATFNRLARALLREAQQAHLGSVGGGLDIDPNDPLEADFVPVSNFSKKKSKKKARRRG